MALGLDLSLTSTGLVVLADGEFGTYGNIKSSGKRGDGYAEFYTRIDAIAQDVETWLWTIRNEYGPADIAVIEAPSHGSKFGNPHERAGLWWRAYELLYLQEVPIIAGVAPTTNKKYLTGSGKAEKEAMLEAARARYSEDIPNHDVADAASLAAMGSRHAGCPAEYEPLPKPCMDAFEGVKWPTT